MASSHEFVPLVLRSRFFFLGKHFWFFFGWGVCKTAWWPWSLTLSLWQWYPSHVWRRLPLCQFSSSQASLISTYAQCTCDREPDSIIAYCPQLGGHNNMICWVSLRRSEWRNNENGLYQHRGSDVAAMIKQCQNFKQGFPNFEARISASTSVPVGMEYLPLSPDVHNTQTNVRQAHIKQTSDSSFAYCPVSDRIVTMTYLQ